MRKCRIKVIKTAIYQDLAEEYCCEKVSPCPCFRVGQEFIAGLEKPENFCDWAWKDIHPFVAVLLTGGNFSDGLFDGWMKDGKQMVACCSDGIRPVVFLLEVFEE